MYFNRVLRNFCFGGRRKAVSEIDFSLGYENGQYASMISYKNTDLGGENPAP